MRGACGINWDHRQVALIYFQDCQIGQAVRADQQRLIAAAVLDDHGNLLRILDHVSIGQDIATFIHDHA
ncbi:hypothetical protein D3C71_1446420 [compost metagenome]